MGKKTGGALFRLRDAAGGLCSLSLIHILFGKAALVQPVDTAQLSVAGTLAGCGPAFAAMFIEALADGAVQQLSLIHI